MNRLINQITTMILSQLHLGETNMVRLEGFEDPLIYKGICERLRFEHELTGFVAKLTLEKYNQFRVMDDPNWSQALMYLHTGLNLEFSDRLDSDYQEKSFVDFNQAITRWRNASPDMPEGTTLILLMGTEAALDDAGSLKDTTFKISPDEIIEHLRQNYSEWFRRVLIDNDIDTAQSKKAINTLYKVIFREINIDLAKLSVFVDSLDDCAFASSQELIEYICGTLSTVWGIPNIENSVCVPKVSTLEKGTLKSAKIVTDAIRFIKRMEDIPTAAAIKRLNAKFDAFAEEKYIVPDEPYPSGTGLFSSYRAFQQCVIDFMSGIDLASNRKKLLSVDYAIIHEIIGTKLPPKETEQTISVTGNPMVAYSKIFLTAADQFKEKFNCFPDSYCIRMDGISLSDCSKSNMEEAFKKVCYFLGGILTFFNEASISDECIKFVYENEEDPFDYENYSTFSNKIHSTGKWGEPCKISFTVKAAREEDSKNYDFKWVFSPYASWNSAFSYLGNVLFRGNDGGYTLPTMVVCNNIQDYLCCESSEEFYAQLGQIEENELYQKHKKEVKRYFSGHLVMSQFEALCLKFREFAIQLTSHGLFSSLMNLREVVVAYTDMMQTIRNDYTTFSDIQKEKLPLLLNCFVITSNEKVIEKCDMGEVIVPAYHPVILEKMDAQQIFIREGFAELLAQKMGDTTTKEKMLKKLTEISELASITQGVDTILKNPFAYLTCKNMWEYYGVYYGADAREVLLAGNAFGSTIVTDDEDSSAMLEQTPVSGIVIRNVLDYIHTFPARADGLNIAFIAPLDMQHIVASVHIIAKTLEKSARCATINLRIICLNSKKNSASYLRKWLDNYFADEKEVKVNTFLYNTTVSTESDTDCLNALLQNCDICFNYDILEAAQLQFDITGDEIIDKDQTKFPMTFTPDTISATHGKSRKVSVSQFQFLASKSQTQASYIVGHPNSMPGIFRTFQTMELTDIRNHIIEISHKKCKWVVCVDPAVDRRMLEAPDSRIIGFTTGEGSYGELNVTVSARKDILSDIKLMLQRRLSEKFQNWDIIRLQKAVDYCVDTLSPYMDGSRILKALNPYDYEIHNFLAYVMTLQILGLTQENSECAVRALISLDSYKHWFTEDECSINDNKRPDFMLLEIPCTPENFNPNQNLHIRIKIIECKMGFENSEHLKKAQSQIEKGLRTMVVNWNPKNKGIMHRYWLNQLYRAIIFSPLNLSNTSEQYTILRNKIYDILSQKYDIEWSSDIFAFWLNSGKEKISEEEYASDIIDELRADGFDVSDIGCHCYGQLYIQKMLVPPEERMADFTENIIIDPSEQDTEDEEEEELIEKDPAEHEDKAEQDIADGHTIPSISAVNIPFLTYLSDKVEHTRQDSLNWFGEHFSISVQDRTLTYESNGHPKWETVLDRIISNFRAAGILKNSAYAHFHITSFGEKLFNHLQGTSQDISFDQAVNAFAEIYPALETESEISQDNPPEVSTDQNHEMQADVNPAMETENQTAVPALSSVRLLLGEDLRTKEKYYWEFGNKELNNRHLLINGNSGCGKTYCIQTLLMEMALQGVSAVVFDYTGGFTSGKLDPLFREALGDKIHQRVVRIDKIPVNPFVKYDIQIDEGLFVPEEDVDVATKIAETFSIVYSLGDQQKSAVYSAVLAGLKIYGDNMSFPIMVRQLEDMDTSYAKTVLSKIQAFTDINPFAVDENFSWGDIRDSGGMVYVIQLAGYARDIQVLLTELLLWDIWNFCVKTGDESKPFVLVMDEAQNLSHNEKSPSAKILTEGRKFGISGWYATQFMKPQLTDDEIQRLQQAGQKLYFCPPDDGVMTVAKNIDITPQGSKTWMEHLKKLKKGECVTCGNMVRNGKWNKYDPKIIKVTSLQERLKHD